MVTGLQQGRGVGREEKHIDIFAPVHHSRRMTWCVVEEEQRLVGQVVALAVAVGNRKTTFS